MDEIWWNDEVDIATMHKARVHVPYLMCAKLFGPSSNCNTVNLSSWRHLLLKGSLGVGLQVARLDLQNAVLIGSWHRLRCLGVLKLTRYLAIVPHKILNRFHMIPPYWPYSSVSIYSISYNHIYIYTHIYICSPHLPSIQVCSLRFRGKFTLWSSILWRASSISVRTHLKTKGLGLQRPWGIRGMGQVTLWMQWCSDAVAQPKLKALPECRCNGAGTKATKATKATKVTKATKATKAIACESGAASSSGSAGTGVSDGVSTVPGCSWASPRQENGDIPTHCLSLIHHHP